MRSEASAGDPNECAATEALSSAGLPGMLSEFSGSPPSVRITEPATPIPVTAWTPLLGPRIFRALRRLSGIDVEANRSDGLMVWSRSWFRWSSPGGPQSFGAYIISQATGFLRYAASFEAYLRFQATGFSGYV